MTDQNPAPATPAPPAGVATVVVERKSPVAAMFVLFVLTLAAGGAAAWWVTQHSGGVNAAPSRSIERGVLMHLDGFTVNLADPEEGHFLRVTLDLELDRLPAPAEKDKPASGVPVPRVRDTILSVLAACKADPLLTPEGKTQLKKNLIEALNRNVPEISVREIYFTEFLVQR